MLNFLCAWGLATCQTVSASGGYNTTYTPDGYLLTHNQGIVFTTTTPPGPRIATHITVVRAVNSDYAEVVYPPGTPWYAPNLHSKASD